MSAPTKPKTREQELRAAIKKSGLPYAAIALYTAVLDKADWATAHMRFQPKSLRELAGWADMSVSYCKQMLNVLERRGWIERKRSETPGRGHTTSYALLLGESVTRRARPMTDAERARRYRQRKAATDPVMHDPESGHRSRDEAAVDRVTKRPVVRDEGPRQGPVFTGGHQGGEEGGDLPASDLVSCQFCDEVGSGELGPVKHKPGCWRGGMWTLYEAER